jgi:hypothetical protein
MPKGGKRNNVIRTISRGEKTRAYLLKHNTGAVVVVP